MEKMPYKLIFIFFIFLSSISVKSQSDTLLNLDQLADATVLLQQPNPDGTAHSGSGTLFKKGTRYFIITASHVSQVMLDNSIVVFHSMGDVGQLELLKNLIVGHKINWENHPSPDIAICEIIPTSKTSSIISSAAIPYQIIHSEKEAVPRHIEIQVLGYPILDVEQKYFSPFSFKTNASSGLLTRLRADTKTPCIFFYLQSPGMQGFSGGGVYAGVEAAMMVGLNKTYFIGITHGTESDTTGGKFEAVTPSFYIKDLFTDK
jgi:hypothetical protein